MKNNIPSDTTMHDIIAGDHPEIKPDPAILERLNYCFLLKNSTRYTRLNSFIPMFSNILLLKSMGLKAGFITLLLAGFLFLGKIDDHQVNPAFSDSCSMRSLMVDTNYMIKDSCR